MIIKTKREWWDKWHHTRKTRSIYLNGIIILSYCIWVWYANLPYNSQEPISTGTIYLCVLSPTSQQLQVAFLCSSIFLSLYSQFLRTFELLRCCPSPRGGNQRGNTVSKLIPLGVTLGRLFFYCRWPGQENVQEV